MGYWHMDIRIAISGFWSAADNALWTHYMNRFQVGDQKYT